jgi:hypothetical protein
LEAGDAAAAMGTSDSHPDIALLLPTWSCPKSKAPNSPKGFRCRPDIKVLFMTGYTRNAVVHNGVRDESVRDDRERISQQKFGKC